jgi:hypothetical protein
MKRTNARAVLYGRSDRLKEVLTERAADQEAEARAAARTKRRRVEAEPRQAPTYSPGKLRPAD